MYAPVPPSGPRIPYLTCLSASTVLYLGLIAGYVAISLQSGVWTPVLGAVLTGLIPWLLSSLVVWLIMRTTNVQPWLLIVITLPFFLILWLMISFFAGMTIALFSIMNES